MERPDELPSVAVLSALHTAMKAPLQREAAILRRQLCCLPLFEHRAASHEIWHPLAEPLEESIELHVKAVHFWRKWGYCPCPEDVLEWQDIWVRC